MHETVTRWPQLVLSHSHNGFVPIKITGQPIKDHMAYFITDENSTKGRDPNINTINGINFIKGKTSVNAFVPDYKTNTLSLTKENT